ncbi:MAG: amidohydrolase family protein [Planctomycetota bacterium]
MRLLPLLLSLLALPLTPALPAQRAQAPDEAPPQDSFAVRCGTLLLGDGETALRDAWLVVRDGKVAAVGADAPPPELPVVDAGDRVVMPGLVAVDTDLVAADDGDYTVTPDVLAIDGFDFEARLWDALEGGITSAYLSPGRERLVSGQGAVVKTAGRDLVARVLTENACLRVNFGDGGVQAPRVFEPTVHPTDEDPLEPARVQTPTARISVLAELRALFADAAGRALSSDPTSDPANDPDGAAPLDAGLRGTGSSENRFDPSALRAVTSGRLPLRAAAWRAADIRRALQLQRELGARTVLENPQEIAPLAEAAAAQGLTAVFRMPVLLGRGNPGGEDRAQDALEPHFDAPARAAAAGMKVAVAPWQGMPLRDYLVAVALAVRHGLPRAQALRAVGGDAAAILGVDARVGTLAPGKDADFVVLSGDPLAIGTMVESTWIDGRRAFQRRTEGQLLAVRVGAIHDGAGNVVRHGVLLVQDGKVKAVGEDLSVPYGARVIDLPDAVMTPGFVDSFSHLGLAGDGTGVPNGAADQRLDLAIAHDDPMFRPALEAGITTLLVSGRDGGLVSGRVAAVKTGARDHDGMVLAPVCGQRLVFDAIGPDSQKPLQQLLERGKKYAKAWTDYDKALAEWKAGKKPAPAVTTAPPADAAAADPVTGTWEAELDIQGQFQVKVVVDLRLEGTAVTGTVQMSVRGRDLPPVDITSGSFANGRARLEFSVMGGTAVIEGAIADDVFEGTVQMGPMGEQAFKARRTAKTSGGSKTRSRGKESADGSPKKPDVDEALEPLRQALEQRAALVVRVQRFAAIRAVVELLTAEKVPFVLHDPDGLLDGELLPDGVRPPVLLEPDVVREDGPRVENDAAQLADQDLPLLFGTGDCAGARFLPLHAAYAVRYGLAPDRALLALSANAARAFRLEHRIGTLQRGRDADFVVFSGDPFEPTSRVLLVGCNGAVAVDNREVTK